MNGARSVGHELLRRWPLVLVLALLVHLAFGIFGRVLWKPDEPREAAIAGRMARSGADAIVPHLGDAAFCEKPPLYYWVAAGAIRLLGPGVVPTRLPNLAYALAGALLVGLLANAAAGRAAALAAGLLMGTFYLAYRVEIWIATDALLMTSVAGALFGCYRGLSSRRGLPKLGWYAVMHLFLAVGFMTKNVVAWIVPALALLAFVAWERRWRELLAWELYAGLILQAAAVLPWVLAVAAEPAGATYLRIFFVDNLLGRFTPIEGVGYSEGHRGWLGKYLVELPIYLLPWSFVMAAAVAAAGKATRASLVAGDAATSGQRSAWRFAVAAIVPAFVLLSLSTTMRDVYLGVLMPGFALLGGLWVQRAVAAPGRLDWAMARATLVLLAAVAALVAAATVVTAWRVAAPVPPLEFALLAVTSLAALALVVQGWRALREGRLAPTLGAAVAAWIVTLLGVAPALFPVINRSQDLSPVAVAARTVGAMHPIALWQPDETIVGVLDLYAGMTPPCVVDPDELHQRLRSSPDLRVLTEVSASRGKQRRITDLVHGFGLTVERRLDLPAPQGRRYAILALPGH
jgi:4-amino-4-deoxy-L-arabinose transferase-like glycosyltransferase